MEKSLCDKQLLSLIQNPDWVADVGQISDSAADVKDRRDVSFNLGVRGEKESGFTAMAAAGDGVPLEQTSERVDCETKRQVGAEPLAGLQIPGSEQVERNIW